MPRLPAALLTTLLLRSLALPRATLLTRQRRIVRRRQRTVRRITLQKPIVLIHPLPQRGDLRQQPEHQLNRRLTTRPSDPFRIRNTHDRKIPCALKESSRSPRPHVNAYPAAVHHGQAQQLHAARAVVLDAAYAQHPERFVRKPPVPPELPTAAWINKPDTKEVAH